MAVSIEGRRRLRLLGYVEHLRFPWLIVSSVCAMIVALILLARSGVNDADTDYLSMSVLIAAFALASTLNRRTGIAVAVLAGVVAAIIPGRISLIHIYAWDSLFRLCFLVAMSVSFYRVILALRDREDHLERQLANVQRLQEEVTTLHGLTARAPVDRGAVYDQIARAALRLGIGTRSRLMLRDAGRDRWNTVAQWPPATDNGASAEGSIAPGVTAASPYTIVPGPDGRQQITVPLATGDRLTGALQLARDATAPDTRESAQLLAIYARNATLTLEHVALQQRLEYFAVMGERGRIARDLHDGLVQSLAGIAFHLEYYRDALGPEAATVRAGFDNMARAVKDALHEARAMIHELRSEPQPESVCAALGDLVDRVAAKAELPIVAEIPEETLPITRAQAGALLRIAQEGLQNVVKHAAASRAWLTLTREPDRIVLRLADNGRGFTHPAGDEAGQAAHFGLLGMNERAVMHGGELTIESRPNEGTTVTLVFPVAGKEMDS